MSSAFGMLACSDAGAGERADNQHLLQLEGGEARIANAARLQGSLRIRGEWRFYWKEFVDPAAPFASAAETSNTSAKAASPVLAVAPGSWNSLVDSPSGYASYRARMALPPQTPPLALRVGEVGTAYRIYANGEELGGRGHASENPNNGEPALEPQIFRLPDLANADELILTLHVSNYDYRKAGIWHELSIGVTEALRRERLEAAAFDAFFLGSLFVIGLYHLAFYLVRRSETALLYFGLACITVALREFSIGERPLLALAPWTPFSIYIRIEFLTLILAPLAWGAYLRALFPHRFSRNYFRFMVAAAVLASAVALLLPPRWSSYLVQPYQVHTLVFLGYAAFAVASAWLRDRLREGGVVLFVGLLVVATAVNDMLHSNLIIRSAYTVQIGMLCFVFSQAVLLALRISRALASEADIMRRLREQNETLAEKNAALEQLQIRLEIRSNVDQLTGLPNRVFMRVTLEESIREGAPFAVLFVNLENFGTANDLLGHAGGDRILTETADRLRACLEPGDGIARFEGDEFVLLLHLKEREAEQYPAQLGELSRTAERIRAAILEPYRIDAQEFYSGARIGIALYPEDGLDAETLIQRASSALANARAHGRSIQFYHEHISSFAQRRADLQRCLRLGLERNEFHTVFQPIIELKTGVIRGAESLLRWNSAELGQVRPDEFISAAEDAYLIEELGYFALESSCRRAREWQRILPGFTVSVNVSPRQLHQGGGRIVHSVKHVLRSTDLEPHLLKLEITEGSLLQDDAPETLGQLAALGVRLVLDDFGTGYSSFAYLRKFQFHELKIDRSFLPEAAQAREKSVARAIVFAAHQLQMPVVFEGVENLENEALLRSLRCDFAQGYWYGRPQPADEFEAMLRMQAGVR